MEVLVVDDDAVSRMLMMRLLSKLGCKVSIAENGETALTMILGRKNGTYTHASGASAGDDQYAVVFLDNHLPGMSGRSLVSRLRDLKRRDFVVGITGDVQTSNQQAYLAAGVDHVLTKPIQECVLREVLALASGRHEHARKS